MYALCFKLKAMMSDTKLETMVKLELRYSPSAKTIADSLRRGAFASAGVLT